MIRGSRWGHGQSGLSLTDSSARSLGPCPAPRFRLVSARPPGREGGPVGQREALRGPEPLHVAPRAPVQQRGLRGGRQQEALVPRREKNNQFCTRRNQNGENLLGLWVYHYCENLLVYSYCYCENLLVYFAIPATTSGFTDTARTSWFPITAITSWFTRTKDITMKSFRYARNEPKAVVDTTEPRITAKFTKYDQNLRQRT